MSYRENGATKPISRRQRLGLGGKQSGTGNERFAHLFVRARGVNRLYGHLSRRARSLKKRHLAATTHCDFDILQTFGLSPAYSAATGSGIRPLILASTQENASCRLRRATCGSPAALCRKAVGLVMEAPQLRSCLRVGQPGSARCSSFERPVHGASGCAAANFYANVCTIGMP